MEKKYFFFDIDGTLTDDRTKQVVPSAMEAVKKLMDAGHFVSICTGRALYKAEPFRAKYHFPNMVCNGGHGIFYEGQVKENGPIDYDKALAMYRQAIDAGYGVLVAIDDSKDVYANSFKFYDQVGLRKEPTRYIIDENFDPADYDQIFKMYVSVPADEEDRLPLIESLGHLRYVKDYLMFQHDDKKLGIEKMLAYAGGSLDDVIVFGDDYNDLDMFDDRFYCVAMGNACDALKEKANYVAEKNVEDGIYKACQAHGWF